MSKPANHQQRLKLARVALEGLALGDAFGSQFFIPDNHKYLFGPKREEPPAPWNWTDDAMMGCAIYDVLSIHGRIHQDDLAANFARRFDADWKRGYGPGMIRMLTNLNKGGDWRSEARNLFSGTGSMGNGGAMRVAPVAGYFADDYTAAVKQATLSAEVTHVHPEGIAGAVAATVAGVYAWQNRDRCDDETVRRGIFQAVLEHTPAGETWTRIEYAAGVPFEHSVESAARILGNGSKVTAPDTLPLCLWLCGRHLHQFTEAMWTCVKAGGDIDTNAAIVGGIVALAVGMEGMPVEWIEDYREDLLITASEE